MRTLESPIEINIIVTAELPIFKKMNVQQQRGKKSV